MGQSFKFVENGIVRLLLVLYITLSANVGYMSGLLSFLAVYTILIERNHEVLLTYKVIKDKDYEIIREKHCKSVSIMNKLPQFDRVILDPRTTQQQMNAASSNYDTAQDLKDNIPRLETAPLTDAAPSFYKEKNLL